MLTLYFPDETNEVLAIVMIEDVQFVPAPGLFTIIAHDDDVFEADQPRELRIRLDLFKDERDSLSQLLRKYLDVFAWSYEDMSGLDPSIVEHHLPLLPHVKQVKQKLTQLHLCWSLQVKKEIQKQLSVGFLSVVEYLKWLANVVHVPKKDDKVRVCVDFRDLNKASPKDDFHLPHIDMLVDSTTSHSVYSFIAGFSWYNKIMMSPEDMEKTSFITEKLLGYMVSDRGIEVDPDKIRAILNMSMPRTKREIKEVYQREDCCRSLSLITIYDGKAIDGDFQDENITTVTSLSSWCMYFDGAANHSRYGIGVLLISPHGDHIPRSVRLGFSDRHPAMNNIIEYEACILGLEIALELRIRQIEVFGDSNLILVRRFDDLIYTHLPRMQNQFVDALATLTSMIDILVDRTSTDQVMREVHAGVCRPHMEGHMLAHTLEPHSHSTFRVTCTDFAMVIFSMEYRHYWEISLKSSNGHEFILVTVDYFTKWVEVASYARLTSSKIEMGSLRVALEQQISEANWAQARLNQLNLLDERRLRAVDHVRAYQRKMASAFKKRVKPKLL
ncbi:Transposon Ty3-I Gag-Pol polyprotein [Vitis vinifera]|uniref:Transposon Ty3-I Gag-Pol polyprotein n=1 Tax=Vitis vinifera TaxID=29760 RepID=A0A438CNP6_VITVI|nr:Transposon Ty3-I Gag-Pol polyprotein [Vitis vinifera]